MLNKAYNGEEMIEVFYKTKYIVRKHRDWFNREAFNAEIHPVIRDAIMLTRPNNWQQLLLEYPHQAEKDPTRIAYTRDDRAGEADRQTVTTIGKYLNRHFDLNDHAIRDLSAFYSATEDTFKFVHTMAEMLYHLNGGPMSCMVGTNKEICCTDRKMRHPYQVYDPAFGWHMAVHVKEGRTDGRALCMHNEETGKKYYVRSYQRPKDSSSYSQVDDAMNKWLEMQGYEKQSYWDEGEQLAYYPAEGGILAPYIDGGHQNLSIDKSGAKTVLLFNDDGEYCCDETGGVINDTEDGVQCEECNDYHDEDDSYWVGRGEDRRVCTSCIDNYAYAYGRRGNQYHEHYDNCVEVNGDWYADDYLSDNGIVELENGEYESMDECVHVDDEWYHVDDERIVRCTDDDEYHMMDDCWCCSASGDWYSDSVEFVMVNDEKFHPENAPVVEGESE